MLEIGFVFKRLPRTYAEVLAYIGALDVLTLRLPRWPCLQARLPDQWRSRHIAF